MATERLIVHRIKCLICGDILESFGSTERVDCSCDDESGTRIFIAGGTTRPIFGYTFESEYEDLSLWETT